MPVEFDAHNNVPDILVQKVFIFCSDGLGGVWRGRFQSDIVKRISRSFLPHIFEILTHDMFSNLDTKRVIVSHISTPRLSKKRLPG